MGFLNKMSLSMGYLGTDRSLGRSNGQVGMTSWVVNRCWQMETMLTKDSGRFAGYLSTFCGLAMLISAEEFMGFSQYVV